MMGYGYILFYGIHPSQKKEGLKYVKMASDKGNAKAQKLYTTMQKELENIKEKADNGDKNSMLQYALMLFNGDGVHKMAADKDDANAQYKMAADKGISSAIIMYGQLIMHDDSFPDKLKVSAFYLKKGVDLGVTEAMYLYACLIIDYGIISKLERSS